MLNVINGFFGCLTSLGRLVSCAKSFLSKLQVHGNRRVVERLIVGVAEYKRDVMNTFTIHMINGIATSTADTYHLNDAVNFLRFTEIQD